MGRGGFCVSSNVNAGGKYMGEGEKKVAELKPLNIKEVTTCEATAQMLEKAE